MGNNDKAMQTTKDVLMIVGTMLGAVAVLMVIGFAVIGGVALLMSTGTVLASAAATLLVIFLAMRMLSLWFRALVWHGFWLLVSAAVGIWLISMGQANFVLIGTLLGVFIAGLLGHLTTHTCSHKGVGDMVESYADASGRSHRCINLDATDLPGTWTTRHAGRIWAGLLLALAIMGWGSLLNAFGSAPFLTHCWALVAGVLFGYSLLTLLIVGLLIEPRFQAHVRIQYLPADAAEKLGIDAGQRGPVQSFVSDVSIMVRDLFSVSVSVKR